MSSLSCVALRPIAAADLPLLEELYAFAREQEMAQLDWREADKSAFLRQQFQLQHQYYQQHYANARFDVIEMEGQGVGRLYWQWREAELRLMDIALLPQWRGRGIGSLLVGELMRQSAERQLPIVLHVEPYNRAVAWYDRLGFLVRDDNGVYLQMVWHPGPGQPDEMADNTADPVKESQE